MFILLSVDTWLIPLLVGLGFLIVGGIVGFFILLYRIFIKR